jgi:hypothetical protein
MSKPPHIAYVVSEAKDSVSKGYWREIGAVWPHKNGSGSFISRSRNRRLAQTGGNSIELNREPPVQVVHYLNFLAHQSTR